MTAARKAHKREPVNLRVIKGGFEPADRYAESQLRGEGSFDDLVSRLP